MNNSLRRQIVRGMTARQIAVGILRRAESRIEGLDAEFFRIAHEAAEDIKARIRAGLVRPVNAPEYVAWKRRHGKSDNPLMCDGYYVDSVGVVRIARSMYYVGVPRNKLHPTSGLSYVKLANILENGTLDGIPARPHLAPARRRAMEKVKQVLIQSSKPKE